MSDRKIILIGYSGHGLVVADCAIENNMDIIGYTENNPVLINPFQLEYLGHESDQNFFKTLGDAQFLIGIGDNYIREKVYNYLGENHCECYTLRSHTASISKSAFLGKGTFVNKNVAINALAQIGNNVILNTGCIIEHDCKIGNSSHIAPGAVIAGNVTIGERCFVGANAVIKQGVTLGDDVVIGAGSVIIKDIPKNKRVVGNPSRFI